MLVSFLSQPFCSPGPVLRMPPILERLTGLCPPHLADIAACGAAPPPTRRTRPAFPSPPPTPARTPAPGVSSGRLLVRGCFCKRKCRILHMCEHTHPSRVRNRDVGMRRANGSTVQRGWRHGVLTRDYMLRPHCAPLRRLRPVPGAVGAVRSKRSERCICRSDDDKHAYRYKRVLCHALSADHARMLRVRTTEHRRARGDAVPAWRWRAAQPDRDCVPMRLIPLRWLAGGTLLT